MRADSRRNYSRLLAAADKAFTEHGTSASLEAIARVAGVASGTLYSHFPNRTALIAALLRERHDALFARGEQMLTEPPAEALTAWIHAVVDHAATYQGLAGVLVASRDDGASLLHDDCQRMTSLGERLTSRAATAGVLREDVTADDVFALINSAAWVRGQISADQADRLVAFAIKGFSTG